MFKKLLTIMLALLLLCPVLPVAAESRAGVKTFLSDDFEGYTYPADSDGTIISSTGQNDNGTATANVRNAEGVRLDSLFSCVTYQSTAKLFLDTVQRDGKQTKAVCLNIYGNTGAANNVRFGVKNTVAKQIAAEDYTYAIFKIDVKNGSTEVEAANLRFLRSAKFSFGYDNIGGVSITPGDWNEYMFIMDEKTSPYQVRLAVNGVMTDITYDNLVLNPKTGEYVKGYDLDTSGISVFGFAAGKKVWFDNAELIGTDRLDTVLKSSTPAEGVLNADCTDEIILELDGPQVATELTTDNVTVTKEKNSVSGAVSVDSVTYSGETNTVAIKLTEQMEESCSYTVHIPALKNIFVQETAAKDVNFRTTGPVNLGIEAAFKKAASGSAMTSLSSGMVEVTAKITNNDLVTMASGTIIAELKKDGEKVDMAYRTVTNLPVEGTAEASFAFTVPAEGNCQLLIYAKDSLNGSYAYSDVITLSASGKATAPATAPEAAAMLAEPAVAENSVKFYSLTLGATGARNEISTLTSGLIDCCASVKLEQAENPFVIFALKKNGMLIRTVYASGYGEAGDNIYHAALNVPEGEGYQIDVFVWSDFQGTDSYFAKTKLS